MELLGKKILLGVCGGIAAYKSVQLVRELKRQGADVIVVMTEGASQFITALTFQAVSGNPVRQSLWDKEAEHAMGHIELARWADLLLIAPLSADFLAKMAHGFADQLLSTLLLVAHCPVLVCPAMNPSMWAHPATCANMAILKERGVICIGPVTGDQACGEYGEGRMAEPLDIVDAVIYHSVFNLFKGREVIITAGPTREAIDPVRYITNHSSGYMAYSLATAFVMAGAKVHLISGSVSLSPPLGVLYYPVDSAADMLNAVMDVLTPDAIFIGAAAVADFKPEQSSHKKVKKQSNVGLNLKLVQNPDIIAKVAHTKKAAYVAGFAAETDDLLEHARAKRQKKGMDLVIANEVGIDKGFGDVAHEVVLISASDEIKLPKQSKRQLAMAILQFMAKEINPQECDKR